MSSSDAVLARRLALAVAGGRLALGAVAVARPSLPARPWVGAGIADQRGGRVLARGLGGRDLALAAGTVWALRDRSGGAAAAAWVAASAAADLVDALATLGAWPHLPRRGRLLVTTAAAGAAAAGALATAGLLDSER